MTEKTKPEPKLLDRVRRRARAQHLSLSTERSYVSWIKRYILFHGKRHPKEMAEKEVNAFLTHLAADRNVSASTQTQALCALVFLWGAVEIFRGGFDEPTSDFELPPVAAETADSVLFERVTDAVVLARVGEEWLVKVDARPQDARSLRHQPAGRVPRRQAADDAPGQHPVQDR